MRALLLILIILLYPLSGACSVPDCVDTAEYYDDKCNCTDDTRITDDNGIMPCIQNKNFGGNHDPKKRHFFIHKHECLSAMGV
jgi:hypothetical protein